MEFSYKQGTRTIESNVSDVWVTWFDVEKSGTFGFILNFYGQKFGFRACRQSPKKSAAEKEERKPTWEVTDAFCRIISLGSGNLIEHAPFVDFGKLNNGTCILNTFLRALEVFDIVRLNEINRKKIAKAKLSSDVQSKIGKWESEN